MSQKFEYQGQVYELPDGTTPEEAKKKILNYLEKTKKGTPQEEAPPIQTQEPQASPEKTGLLEDAQIGLENIYHMGRTNAELAVGGVASAVGATDMADDIYQQMEARKEARKKELATKDQGFGGKVVSGLTGVLPALALAGPLGVAGAAGVFGGGQAIESSQEDIQSGVDYSKQAVLTKTIADAALNTLAVALPIGKGVVQGIKWGVLGNVVAQAGTDVAGKAALATAGGDKTEAEQRYGFDLEKYGVTATVGGLFGAVAGKVGTKPTKEKGDGTPPPNDLPQNNNVTARDVAERNIGVLEGNLIGLNRLLHTLNSRPTKNLDPDAMEKLKAAIAMTEDRIRTESEALSDYRQFLGEPPTPKDTADTPTAKPEIPTKEEIQGDITTSVENVVKNADQIAEDTKTANIEQPNDGEIRKQYLDLLKEIEEQGGDLTKVTNGEARWEALTKVLDQQTQDTLKAIVDNNQKLTEHFDPQFESALREGGHEAALDYLINNKGKDVSTSMFYSPHSYKVWGMVAEWIKGNPLVRPRTQLPEELSPAKLADMEASGAVGEHSKTTGDIRFTKRGVKSPEAYLHEVVHNATSRVIDIVERYVTANIFERKTHTKDLVTEIGRIPYRSLKAVNNLRILRQQILRQHDPVANFPNLEHAFSNIHEFVAYGMSDPSFQAYLSSITLIPREVKGRDPKTTLVYPYITRPMNALRAVMNMIKETLNISKPELHTALDELMIHGSTLLKQSEGRALPNEERVKFGMGTLEADTQAVTSKANQKGFRNILESISITEEPMKFDALMDEVMNNPSPDSPKYTIIRNWFGKQQIGEDMKRYPLIRQMLSAMRWGEDKGIAHQSWYLYGKDQSHKFKSMFVKLSKDAHDASIPGMIKKYPLEDWIPVVKLIQEAGWRKIDQSVMLHSNMQHLTPAQQKLYKGLVDAFNRDLQNQQRLQTETGMSMGSRTKKFAGWHPLVHKGDYEVMASYLSAPFYKQRFRTEIEAKRFAEKMAQDPNWKGLKINLTDVAAERRAEPQLLAKQEEVIKAMELEVAKGRLDPEALDDARTRFHLMRVNAGFGGHNKPRIGLLGAEGSKLYSNDKQNAVEFRQALLDYGDEMRTHITKKYVSLYADQMLQNPILQKHYPNQLGVVQHYRDMATNTFNVELLDRMTLGLKTFVDTNVVKAVQLIPGMKEWYPQTHIVDKTLGVATHLFYMSSLTTRPGFWIAQVLSSPQSLRQLFRSGSTYDALHSAGKGMMNVFSGGDADFQKAVHFIASYTNTFHPQFINEINSIGLRDYSFVGKTGIGKFLRKVLPWATGEKQSAAADAVSRYISFAMFYEHHKAQGKTGQDLWRAAAHDTDISMVMYNNPNRAPIIRKAGLFGEMVAPLQTFATAQVGNLLSDIKFMAREKTIKSTLPFVTTALVTMMMGGAVGLPVIVEYEALRRAIIYFAPETGHSMPSILETLNRKEVMEMGKEYGVPKGTISYGLPSAATGFDIGSGLRWNAILSRALTENQSLLTIFPAVEFGRQLVDRTIKGIKYEAGSPSVSKEEYRQSVLKLSSFLTFGKGVVDETFFNAGGRTMVPGGARGYAQRPQTDKERVSTFLGSATMEAAHQRGVETVLRREEEQRTKEKQRAIDAIMDGLTNHDPRRTVIGIQEAIRLGMQPDQINRQLESLYMKQNIPAQMRFFMNRNGELVTPEQYRKYKSQSRFY